MYGTQSFATFYGGVQLPDLPNGAQPTSIGSVQALNSAFLLDDPYIIVVDNTGELWKYPVAKPSTDPDGHNMSTQAGEQWTSCGTGYKYATDESAINSDGEIILAPCSKDSVVTAENLTRTASNSSQNGETLHFTRVWHRFDNGNFLTAWMALSDDGRLFGSVNPKYPWVESPINQKIKDVTFRGLVDKNDTGAETWSAIAITEDGSSYYNTGFTISCPTDSATYCNKGSGRSSSPQNTGRKLASIPAENISIGADGSMFNGYHVLDASQAEAPGGTSGVQQSAVIPVKYGYPTDHRNYATDKSSQWGLVITGIPSSDTTPPVIHGADNKTIQVGDQFDPKMGVTAVDDVDGDITSHIHITGSVNVNTPGEYQLTYNVADSAGNKATPVTRTITVAASSTTIACAPQTGDPAASIWQSASIIMGCMAILLAGCAVRLKQRTLSGNNLQ